jgi:hypothetical protein
MGWFTPKISAHQLQQVEGLLKQAKESAHLVNTTVKPEVFFGRLNFLLDVLLELQKYERYKVFSGSLPSRDYNRLLCDLEKTVDSFISRAIMANNAKIASLKTPAAKERNRSKFLISLSLGFAYANTFWQGNGMCPHYCGPLFTKANKERIEKLLQEADAHK